MVNHLGGQRRRNGARPCKAVPRAKKNALKIRRPKRAVGENPPPGTTESMTYRRMDRGRRVYKMTREERILPAGPWLLARTTAAAIERIPCL